MLSKADEIFTNRGWTKDVDSVYKVSYSVRDLYFIDITRHGVRTDKTLSEYMLYACLKKMHEKGWLEDPEVLELFDKPTPKKPIERHYEDEGEPPYVKVTCPNGCHVQVSPRCDKYCPLCGQKIDWDGD